MTDQLTADVERWLAEQVRTTWPGKSGDCCDAGERADMARWFAGQILAFEAWRGKPQVDLDGWHKEAAAHCATPAWVIADRIMSEADRICDLSPREMTWTMLDANVRHLIGELAVEALHDTGYVIGRIDATNDGEAAVCPVTASEPPNSTPTAQETNRTPQSDVVNTLLEAAGAARTRTLPPPKPGTKATHHCAHWTVGGNEQCCDCGQVVPDSALDQPWCLPTANRQENA